MPSQRCLPVATGVILGARVVTGDLCDRIGQCMRIGRSDEPCRTIALCRLPKTGGIADDDRSCSEERFDRCVAERFVGA